jgi:hypothetical protein
MLKAKKGVRFEWPYMWPPTWHLAGCGDWGSKDNEEPL